MPTRRRVLATLLATAAAVAVPWRPRPGLHLVDGWILTAADLERLGPHAS